MKLISDLEVMHPHSDSLSIWFRVKLELKCCFLRREKNKITHAVEARIWTWATLMGDKCSTTASLFLSKEQVACSCNIVCTPFSTLNILLDLTTCG